MAHILCATLTGAPAGVQNGNPAVLSALHEVDQKRYSALTETMSVLRFTRSFFAS